MNKYEFIFDADKTTVVDKLLDGVIKADFSENVKLFEKDAIYGRLSNDTNKIFLPHEQPAFSIPAFAPCIADRRCPLRPKFR